MGRAARRAGRISGAAGLAAVVFLSLSGAVRAEGNFTLNLAEPKPGLDTDIDEDGVKNAGPGVEQPTVTAVVQEDATHVVTIWMSSSVESSLEPWQCKCSSVKLSATGPEIVADQVLLTKNGDSDRPCNHPFAVSDGLSRVVWAWGQAADNASQTQTYVQVLDEKCNALTTPLRISDNENHNQGAPELAWAGGGRITAAYYDNTAQKTYYRPLQLLGGQVAALGDSQVVVEPSDIGRPTIADSDGKSLVCAAKGENRPPELGVACALVDTQNGTVLWHSEEIAKSDPANGSYFNQPSLATLGSGRFALHVIESSGQGKATGTKGGQRVHVYVLEPTAAGPGILEHYHDDALGLYSAHSAIVSGAYGPRGARAIGLFEASFVGNGVALLTMVGYEPATAKLGVLDVYEHQWPVGATVSDSGYFANIYGQNPNERGRDFLRGVGDVPNPGAGKEGAFEPRVKTWFAVPYAGRKSGSYKNGLYLGFIPGLTTEQLVPGDEDPEEPPDPDPPGSSSGAGQATGAGAGPAADPDPISEPRSFGGCGCSTQTGSGLAGPAAVLGVLLLSMRRRRRGAALGSSGARR